MPREPSVGEYIHTPRQQRRCRLWLIADERAFFAELPSTCNTEERTYTGTSYGGVRRYVTDQWKRLQQEADSTKSTIFGKGKDMRKMRATPRNLMVEFTDMAASSALLVQQHIIVPGEAASDWHSHAWSAANNPILRQYCCTVVALVFSCSSLPRSECVTA